MTYTSDKRFMGALYIANEQQAKGATSSQIAKRLRAHNIPEPMIKEVIRNISAHSQKIEMQIDNELFFLKMAMGIGIILIPILFHFIGIFFYSFVLLGIVICLYLFGSRNSYYGNK